LEDHSRFQQVEVHLFAFLLLICLCLLVEPHPPNGYNPPLIYFVLRVLFHFVFVHWLDFFVDMSVLKFVYIAILADVKREEII
jgi:hypothetical protein